ncbi:cytochrome c maturation protein CcmE [Myxococcota bacterium]|nr:cytochrome c maturation protein CcmE [Myxococcota bacterium]
MIAVIALAVCLGAIVWIARGSMGDNLVYYWSPADLEAQGERAFGTPVRLGGQIEPGSIDWRPETQDLYFVVTDGGAKVKVHSKGTPPQMFSEAQGVVVEGTIDAGGVFESTNLMVKHGNEYRAPAPGEEPQQVYRSLVQEDGP